MLRKVKLKVGGVTHKLHTNLAFNGASSGVVFHEDFSVSRCFTASEKDDSSVDTFLHETFDDDNSPSKVVRKSKRVPKPRLLDDRPKTSKPVPYYAREYGDDGEEGSRKHRKISTVLKTKSGSDSTKNSRSKLVNEDVDFMGEEESTSDGELEHKKEVSLTSRLGASMIEFPNGLPPTPPRIAHQLKKSEEAHRHKTQAEKEARESEAEAIRKILDRDYSKKKKEDKLQRRRDEISYTLFIFLMESLPLVGAVKTIVMRPSDGKLIGLLKIPVNAINNPLYCTYSFRITSTLKNKKESNLLNCS
ncbi:hypothetical protein MKX01_001300 [Papaver californicum]|nr:hypothetical protein MKX01_001300 [Papaver californicum]